MNIKELIIRLVEMAVAFAFPTIWNWIMDFFPWWPLEPDTTLGIVIGIAITVVSWALGLMGIKKLVMGLKVRGLVVK